MAITKKQKKLKTISPISRFSFLPRLWQNLYSAVGGLCFVLILLIFISSCSAPSPRNNANQSQDCNPAIARVNGTAIHREQLVEILLASRGRTVLDNLILLQLAHEYAQSISVHFDQAMVGRELARVLEDMAADAPEIQQSELLNYMLASRGLSRSEFDIMVETRALLRACVDQTIVITTEQMQQQFQRQYGRHLTVRIITMSNLRQVEQVRRSLQAAVPFIQLVEQYSQDSVSLANQGLIGPFSQSDTSIPEPIRQAAFQLTQLGQVSPVVTHRQGTRQYWSILQLAQTDQPQPVTLEQVSEEIIASLREQTLNQRMTQLAQQLRDQAQVRIIDPTLRNSDGTTYGNEPLPTGQ